jgi:hypothetical protein
MNVHAHSFALISKQIITTKKTIMKKTLVLFIEALTIVGAFAIFYLLILIFN